MTLSITALGNYAECRVNLLLRHSSLLGPFVSYMEKEVL